MPANQLIAVTSSSCQHTIKGVDRRDYVRAMSNDIISSLKIIKWITVTILIPRR
jgi:hypothetical protein